MLQMIDHLMAEICHGLSLVERVLCPPFKPSEECFACLTNQSTNQIAA